MLAPARRPSSPGPRPGRYARLRGPAFEESGCDLTTCAAICRRLMLCSSPSPNAMLISEAPPWVTNGRGMPVIGMIPMTMPTLTTSWNRIIDAIPRRRWCRRDPSSASPRRAPARAGRRRGEHNHAPMNPSSSARMANTKSVVLDGQEALAFCVPLVRPFPNQPPEPTAICAWTAGSPSPARSAAGSRNAVRRCFW